MRAIAGLSAIVFAFGPVPVSSGVAHAAKPVVTHVTFGNGLDVVVVENHAAPLAVVAMWYANGSVDDPPGRAGLAHALEHMLYRGTHALSGAAEFELDARLGIEANAGTAYESTNFREVVPVERVELAMRVEAARMRGGLLRARDWSVERGVVLAELRWRQASRSRMLRAAVRQMVYAGTPYAHDPGGTVEDVSHITAADLRRAYERAYTPQNATLVVTGDVAPARIVALARTIFGKIPGGVSMPPSPHEVPVHRGRTIRVVAPGPDTLVDIALESPTISGSAEAIASELLDPAHEILSLGLVDLGPCSSYEFVDDTQAGAGLYHVICHLDRGADPREPAAVFSAIVAGLARRHDASEFAIARRAVAAADDMVSDDLEGEAAYFGSSFASGTNPNHFRYKASDADIAAMLRRWSTPIAVGILSPAGTLSLSDAPVAQPPNADAPHDADASSVSLPAWVRAELARPPAFRAEGDAPSWFALPNGMRLVVLHRPGGNHAYVRAGFDDANLWGPIGGGVARVAGGVFVAGSRRWPALRVTGAADRHAMSVDFDSESNLDGRTTDLPLMFDMLASTWRAPQIDPGSVQRARRAAIREAERLARDPDRMALNMVTRWLGRPGAPDAGPVAAQRAADTSVNAVRSFFRAHVRPERAWIAVVGDVDPVSVYRQATRAFGGWRVARADPPAAVPPGAVPDGFPHAVRRLRVTRPQTRVLFGAVGPQVGDPDHDGMTLLHAVLAGDMETRLMRTLRVRRGLTYGVSSAYDDNTGRILFMFECAPRDQAAASALVRRSLDDLAVHPPSSDELDRARGMLIGEALREHGSASGMLDALETAARSRTGNDDVAALDARYRAVTVDDLTRIARSYLGSSHFFEVDEGP